MKTSTDLSNEMAQYVIKGQEIPLTLCQEFFKVLFAEEDAKKAVHNNQQELNENQSTATISN
jgi:hypothetical protein